MLWLIVGLVLFLGVHSMRIVAESRRTALIREYSENRYKLLYSVVSAVGLVLIVVGYGAARREPFMLWLPPVWMAHVAALLMLPAFVLLAAAYVPDNRIRAAVGHPMVLGVKVWAFAHLLANGTLPDLVLFGSFLAWAIADYAASRRRDRRLAAARGMDSVGTEVVGGWAADGTTVAAGIVVWVVFAVWLHRWLIGVSPFG